MWIAASIAVPASRASASPMLELVGATVGEGGFNARAYGSGSASVYFNPALLPQVAQGLDLGVFVLNDAVSISLDGRDSSVDVPVTTLRASRFGQYPVPTIWLEEGCEDAPDTCNTPIEAQPRQSAGSSGTTRVYQTLGLVQHLVEDRLTLGFHTLVPVGSLLRGHSFFVDEREQFFSNSLHAELYGDRLVPLSVSVGLGARLADWVSLGVSSSLNLGGTGAGSTYVGNSADLEDSLLLSTEIDAAFGIAPHFAALFEPIDPLDVSVTVHTPQQMTLDIDAGVYLSNGNSQTAERKAVFHWLPWRLGLGASYELARIGEHVWAATATGTYELWSQYLNRQGERPMPGYRWSNVVRSAAGVRYTHAEQLSAFLDGSFRPSPVPPQTGRTNYVDNDAVGVSGGASYEVPIESWEMTLQLGAQLQVHTLLSRRQTKIDPRTAGDDPSYVLDEWPDTDLDPNQSPPAPYPDAQGLQTNNPGWPGFGSSGVLVGGGVHVGLHY